VSPSRASGVDLSRFAAALAEVRARRVGTVPCGPSPLLGDVVIALDTTGSTQEDARDLVRSGVPHGTIVLAEQQTGGRGRRGRTWVSPPGTGIWATVILRRPLPDAAPQALTLAAAVAVCEGARAGGAAVDIKWPNDIVAGGGPQSGSKVAGVLGEMLAADRETVALLGLGVNYDWGAGADPGRRAAGTVADQPVTDLRACGLDPGIGREEVLASITASLEDALFTAATGGLAAILDRWRPLSPSSAGRRVRVTPVDGDETPGERPAAAATGTTKGIAADGSLLVEDDAGVVHIVRFGGTLRFEATERRNADASDH